MRERYSQRQAFGSLSVPAGSGMTQNWAWNVRQSGAGYVTRFQVRRSFLDRYEVHQVGGQTILEYWIPAEDLDALNASIVGTIKVVAEFH